MCCSQLLRDIGISVFNFYVFYDVITVSLSPNAYWCKMVRELGSNKFCNSVFTLFSCFGYLNLFDLVLISYKDMKSDFLFSFLNL